MSIAEQAQRDAAYYAGLLDEIAKHFGGDAFISDDCSRQDAPLRAKMPDLVASLARWKREQLTVTAWWQEIDEFVRAHPGAVLGDTVPATALTWLRERDELLKAIGDFRGQLSLLPAHLSFGGEAREIVNAVIARCAQLSAPKPVFFRPYPI